MGVDSQASRTPVVAISTSDYPSDLDEAVSQRIMESPSCTRKDSTCSDMFNMDEVDSERDRVYSVDQLLALPNSVGRSGGSKSQRTWC